MPDLLHAHPARGLGHADGRERLRQFGSVKPTSEGFAGAAIARNRGLFDRKRSSEGSMRT